MNGLIVLLFLIHTGFSSAQTPASAREFVKQGKLQMSRNMVDAAIKSYSRAVELSPNNTEAYVGRGLARRAKGDLAGAIDDYEKAAAIDQRSIQGNRFVAETYSNRGYIKLNALDVDNAIQDFTTAIRINPDDSDHYYKRGLARLINEDLGPALEDLNKSLSFAPDPYAKILIYASRGMVKLLQNQKVDAEKDFDESVRLSEGKDFMVEGHLRYLQSQIIELRQRRAKTAKSIV